MILLRLLTTYIILMNKLKKMNTDKSMTNSLISDNITDDKVSVKDENINDNIYISIMHVGNYTIVNETINNNIII